MKKIFLCVMCAAALTACNNGANKKDQAFAEERDSLMQVINDKDTELNEIMGTVNEIQEGFRRINEAEGRITATGIWNRKLPNKPFGRTCSTFRMPWRKTETKSVS